jgi:hypothetical protein
MKRDIGSTALASKWFGSSDINLLGKQNNLGFQTDLLVQSNKKSTGRVNRDLGPCFRSEMKVSKRNRIGF